MRAEKGLKLHIALCMLALLAGAIFLCGFYLGDRLPRGTFIDGIEVGGLSRTQAIAAVRRETENTLKQNSLKIRTKDGVYTFSYPEINYRDDLFSRVKNIRRSGEYSSGTRYYLCAENEVIRGICEGQSLPMTEPYADFSAEGEPFGYCEGSDGYIADEAALRRDIDNALYGSFDPVDLKYSYVKRRHTLEEVRAQTALLAQFTTYFDEDNLSRSSNIRRAAASLNGTVVKGGCVLSFNDIVGERTAKRGYLKAKIIENGEYVEGYGGGVCQVSTTLYNAALLSGLKITEYHPHTLAVGYVQPSRDAMVSGKAFDLKIKNPSTLPVYIRTQVSGGSLTVRIYGKRSADGIAIESVISGGIVAPVTETDDPAKVREGKDGILSESYLIVTEKGETRRIFLRSDRYLPQKHVILKENAAPPTENDF